MRFVKVFAIMLFTLQGAVKAQTTSKFQFLAGYDGKYAYQVKLLQNKQLVKELIVLLGNSRFEFLKKNWNVETPMEVKDGIFTASACMQHNCSDTNFVIVVDMNQDKVYAGIRENTKTKVYPASAASPKPITDWLKN